MALKWEQKGSDAIYSAFADALIAKDWFEAETQIKDLSKQEKFGLNISFEKKN